MKYVLLDKSFEALYQNLDDIKAHRIKRAWDELGKYGYANLKNKCSMITSSPTSNPTSNSLLGINRLG